MTRWLDVGFGGNYEKDFYYVDMFPKDIIDPRFRDRYFRVDIINVSDDIFARLGTFDFIRMQHTFEHFSYEEGARVLKNCAKLLHKDGLICITVPDLKIHIQKYLNNEYGSWNIQFKRWANRRIAENAPSSFYFSIFAHSMTHESHKWCYDFEGLKYQLELCGEFKDVRELTLDDELSSVPFTHNRPDEDVCIIATKI